MATEWNLPTFPKNPYDGQVYVDNQKRIYKYSAGNTLWRLYEIAELRQSYSFTSIILGKSIFDNPLTWVQELQPLSPDSWDGIYDKAFLIVTWSDGGSKESRYIYDHTLSDLTSWCSSNIPSSGGNFLPTTVTIQIFEIYDPTYNFKFVTGQNSLYGSARGKYFYYGKEYKPKGLTRPLKYAGLDPRFHSAKWNESLSNFGVTLLNAFYPDLVVPSDLTNNENIIWFSAGRKNLYNQLKPSSAIKSSGRPYYNRTNQKVETANIEPFFYVGAPKLLFQDGMSRSLVEMTALKNNRLLQYGYSCVVVYPLLSPLKDRFAFYLKPLGISHVDFKFNSALENIKVISEAPLRDNHARRIRDLTPYAGNISSLNYSVPVVECFKRTSGMRSPTYKNIPRVIRFYTRDNVNGVRSEHSKVALHIRTNRLNAPIDFITSTLV